MTEFKFLNEFKKIRPNQFSYEGLQGLFAYYEQFETDNEQEIEFDPIAICCEWSEYKDLDDYNEQNNSDYEWTDLCADTQIIDIDKEKFIAMNF